MFKFKKLKRLKKNTDFDIPGSYLGVVLGHSTTRTTYYWKLIEYNYITGNYKRSLSSDKNPEMDRVCENFSYSHETVKDYITSGFWKIHEMNDV